MSNSQSKTFLALILCVGISVGLAAWCQQALVRVQASSANLSGRLLQARSELDAGRLSLERDQARLRDLQNAIEEARNARRAAMADSSPLPAPEQEGWWPTNRPYFYLRKDLLPMARLGDYAPTDEALRSEMKALMLTSGNIGIQTNLSMVVFDAGFNQGNGATLELNPQIALLLAMSPEEHGRVNEICSDLKDEVRRIEAARVQPVEPPVPTGVADGASIIARLPPLTAEVAPLLEQWTRVLEELLGESRAQLLRRYAEDYFNQYEGGLGALPREFMYKAPYNLWVRYTDESGFQHEDGSFWASYGPGVEWQYSHLFGAGAPCEFKPAP